MVKSPALKNLPTKEYRPVWVGDLFLVSLLALGSVSSAALAEDAGVLAYAKSDGEVLLLLGLEERPPDRYCPGLVWKDFVGGVLPRDQGDRRTAAAREFAEETGCVFGDLAAVGDLLQNSEVFGHPTLPTSLYLAEVAYIEDIEAAVDASFPTCTDVVPDRQKRGYAWVPFRDVLDAVNRAKEEYPEVIPDGRSKGRCHVALSVRADEADRLSPLTFDLLADDTVSEGLRSLLLSEEERP